MFVKREQELIRLQDQLDRERELLERARRIEEAALDQSPKFCMTDLYATLPECHTAPIRINSYRPH